MRAPRSLRARIVLAAMAALAVAGLIAIPLLVAAVERDGRDAVDRDLERRAGDIARRALDPGGPGPGPGGGPGPGSGGRFGGPPPGPPRRDELLQGSGTFVQVAVGDQIVEQRGDVPDRAPSLPRGEGLSTVEIEGDPWRGLTLPAGPPGTDARVRVLTTLAPVEARADRIRNLVLAIGFGALCLTGLAAWGFTTLAVRPLGRLREGAARVSGAEDLGTRLPDDDGPEEVRSLARDLNEMLGRLDRAMRATRRFAADAGHEMRTPLTGMRANLDALERNPDLPVDERQALVRAMTAEQERVVHLLEGLQALARGDAADTLPREAVEVGDVVDAAVYAARRRHPNSVFDLDDRLGEATVWGWPSGVRLLIDNLLDNAALHGRPGGRVRALIERDGGTVVARVEDDGPGIPASERERVLEPFARGHGAVAPGTGLGLAIVAQQVTLHGGGFTFGDSELGGLAVEVRLPASAAGERPPPPPPPAQPPARAAEEANPSTASRSKSP